MSTDDTDRFLDGLKACGWFDHLPHGTVDVVRPSVVAAAENRLEPWVGLVAVAVDSAYLVEEAPYEALLRQFARASLGAFAPDRVEERQGDGATRLEFELSGRRYGIDLPPEADDIPPSFYDAIWRAMEDSGTPLRFIELKELGWGPIPGFALTDSTAFDRAVAAKLIPGGRRSAGMSREEMQAFETTIQVALMGTETYYWKVDETTLAEIVLPGTYEEVSRDLRDKGAGVQTTLSYEGCGTITIACGPPADAPMAIPRDFCVQARSQLEDRLTQTGRTRIDRRDCVWRLDKMAGAPVHVLYIVTEKMGERFDKALDSVRLVEHSVGVGPVFASCLKSPDRRRSKGCADRQSNATRAKTAQGRRRKRT